MDNKWSVEPIDEEVIGWNIIDNYSDAPEGMDSVAVVLINDDIQASKDNAALISTAPELLMACKRALVHLDKKLPLYDELEYLINKAEGLEGEVEVLSYFDDIDNIYPESVINIDFSENKCTFVSNAKMSEVFAFQDFGDEVGLIILNISGDFLFEENIDEYDLKYPIGHLISKTTFNDFIEFMSDKYTCLKEFMTEFDSQSEDVPLRSFINNIFFDEFANNYMRELSLMEYLEKYPLILDTDELYMDLSLPKFLEDCPHAIHADIEVSYNGQTVQGIIFYREKENKFFIYNQAQKSVSFFMIPNNDLDKECTSLKFIDLIQN